MHVDTFQIVDMVVHDVPLPNENGDEVILTDEPIELDDDLRRYFRDKIVESLKKRGLDVLADPEGNALVRQSVVCILGDGTQLVPQSQVLARHLFEIQNRRNSEGLLAVATGTIDAERVVSIFKLEREEGLRLQIRREQERTLADVEHLRNLTLTDKTRVFKASVLELGMPHDELTLAGRVSDDQRGIRAGEGVADFFLARFLGCCLRLNPEIATRDFVEAVEGFINSLGDRERQAQYHIALLAALQDQRLDISPASFAEANLKDEDLDAYLESLDKAGLDPNASFQKDLKLAPAKGFKWYFEHGMTLIGSRDDLERGRVRVPSSSGDPVEIHDSLARLKGR